MSIDTSKKVAITVERYLWLIKKEAVLAAYEAAGVDNWSGCEYAFEDICDGNDPLLGEDCNIRDPLKCINDAGGYID